MNITITDAEKTIFQVQVPDFDILTGAPAILSAIASSAKPAAIKRRARRNNLKVAAPTAKVPGNPVTA